MTKIKEKNKNDEKELCEKLIDLLIIYQIEDSHRLIELISHRIKFYDIYIQQLFATKPFFFQKVVLNFMTDWHIQHMQYLSQ